MTVLNEQITSNKPNLLTLRELQTDPGFLVQDPQTKQEPNPWSIQNAKEHYHIPYWGNNFFDININGELTVAPDATRPHIKISLNSITNELLARHNCKPPVLIRFPDILNSRLSELYDAFNSAIANYQYANQYLAAYPVKVNQQKQVVQNIIESAPQAMGLETGSKAELTAVLALANHKVSTIICNGYKDRDYIRLALLGNTLGYRSFIVIEKLSELDTILSVAEEMQIKPRLGVRIKLSTQNRGKWQKSGGHNAKFGLFSSQVLELISTLREHDLLDCLQLLHAHIGSQITNIQDIEKGVSETAHYYKELILEGVAVQTIDVGGGLGVDYEGTQSHNTCSMDYSVRDYAAKIVEVIGDVCTRYNLPQPELVSESGRALTAHHSMMITDVVAVESTEQTELASPEVNYPTPCRKMWQLYQDLLEDTESREPITIFTELNDHFFEFNNIFNQGSATFMQRAWTEKLYINVCHALKQILDDNKVSHLPVKSLLDKKLADKFFVNFSLFQSMPDAWAIDQIFPVIPVTQLDRFPNRQAHIVDITCDSDGAIDKYVNDRGVESTLSVPAWDESKPYRIGFFLLGAYQEILGDMHNLFGTTNTVNVAIDSEGGFAFEALDKGFQINQVLEHVNLSAEFVSKCISDKMKSLELDESTKKELSEQFNQLLDGYTYLNT